MRKPNNLIDELRIFLQQYGIPHIEGSVNRGSKTAEFFCFDDKIKNLLYKQFETDWHRIIIGQISDYKFYCSFQPKYLKTYKK